MGIIWWNCVKMGWLNFGVLKMGALYGGCVLFRHLVSKMCFILAASSIKRLNRLFRFFWYPCHMLLVELWKPSSIKRWQSRDNYIILLFMVAQQSNYDFLMNFFLLQFLKVHIYINVLKKSYCHYLASLRSKLIIKLCKQKHVVICLII